MNLLPKASGTRPRVACEIAPQGVVAARSVDAVSPLNAVAKAELAAGAVLPTLKPGNLPDRLAVVTALRSALEGVGFRSNSRGADLTLIIPDASVRVLLLEFDALSNKLSEALPIVRFRLKKLLPFDADDAMVTFQIMSHSKNLVRVLAVAIPRDVLSEYESAAREAGFEPGAVLPSTVASLAAVDDSGGPVLLVNANGLGVTTAIVRSGILLLHRSIDLQQHVAAPPANLPPALHEPPGVTLPLVDVTGSEAEWAAQQPLPEHGRNPYADRVESEAAVQNQDSITGLPVPGIFASDATAIFHTPSAGHASRSPYAADTVIGDFSSELHNSILIAPTSLGTFADPAFAEQLPELVSAGMYREPSSGRADLAATGASAESEEIAQAVSVAAAYFEDTLATLPSRILSAGSLGAAGLTRILTAHGVAQTDGLSVRELVESSALLSDAVTASVSRGWLASVLGALRG